MTRKGGTFLPSDSKMDRCKLANASWRCKNSQHGRCKGKTNHGHGFIVPCSCPCHKEKAPPEGEAPENG